MSRLARGAWIETHNRLRVRLFFGRASQGARGLKLALFHRFVDLVQSRLARGAWIETRKLINSDETFTGRASQGARGLKPVANNEGMVEKCRASQGARGLKQPAC